MEIERERKKPDPHRIENPSPPSLKADWIQRIEESLREKHPGLRPAAADLVFSLSALVIRRLPEMVARRLSESLASSHQAQLEIHFCPAGDRSIGYASLVHAAKRVLVIHSDACTFESGDDSAEHLREPISLEETSARKAVDHFLGTIHSQAPAPIWAEAEEQLPFELRSRMRGL